MTGVARFFSLRSNKCSSTRNNITYFKINTKEYSLILASNTRPTFGNLAPSIRPMMDLTLGERIQNVLEDEYLNEDENFQAASQQMKGFTPVQEEHLYFLAAFASGITKTCANPNYSYDFEQTVGSNSGIFKCQRNDDGIDCRAQLKIEEDPRTKNFILSGMVHDANDANNVHDEVHDRPDGNNAHNVYGGEILSYPYDTITNMSILT